MADALLVALIAGGIGLLALVVRAARIPNTTPADRSRPVAADGPTDVPLTWRVMGFALATWILEVIVVDGQANAVPAIVAAGTWSIALIAYVLYEYRRWRQRRVPEKQILRRIWHSLNREREWPRAADVRRRPAPATDQAARERTSAMRQRRVDLLTGSIAWSLVLVAIWRLIIAVTGAVPRHSRWARQPLLYVGGAFLLWSAFMYAVRIGYRYGTADAADLLNDLRRDAA